jgi:hypothetical protein
MANKILLRFTISKSKSLTSGEVEASSDLASDLYWHTRENTFVYIDEKTYDLLPRETIESIDENTMNVDDISPEQYEETLENILSKKIVFVKINDPHEIETVNTLRECFTDDDSYIVLEIS